MSLPQIQNNLNNQTLFKEALTTICNYVPPSMKNDVIFFDVIFFTQRTKKKLS